MDGKKGTSPLFGGDRKITVEQAYLAAYQWLREIYLRTGNDEVGGVLGDMSLCADGSTFDSAAWPDWLACVEKVTNGEVDARFQLKGGQS